MISQPVAESQTIELVIWNLTVLRQFIQLLLMIDEQEAGLGVEVGTDQAQRFRGDLLLAVHVDGQMLHKVASRRIS